jgi:hypothetical protein
VDPQPVCREVDPDRAGKVGPQDHGTLGSQPVEHLGGRMPVVVVGADRDDGDGRPQLLDERRGR